MNFTLKADAQVQLLQFPMQIAFTPLDLNGMTGGTNHLQVWDFSSELKVW